MIYGIILFIVLMFIWIGYELWKAPLADEDGNEVFENKKVDKV